MHAYIHDIHAYIYAVALVYRTWPLHHIHHLGFIRNEIFCESIPLATSGSSLAFSATAGPRQCSRYAWRPQRLHSSKKDILRLVFISTHFPPLCPNIFSARPDEHSNHLGTQYFSSWVDAKECALYGEAGFLSCHCHLHVHKYMPCDLSSFCNKEQLLVRMEKAPPVSFLIVS